jgi:hypothetical protein
MMRREAYMGVRCLILAVRVSQIVSAFGLAADVSSLAGGAIMDTPTIRILKLVAAVTFTLIGTAWLVGALIYLIALALTAVHVIG